MSGGRGFHIWEAGRLKAWLPMVLMHARGTVKGMEEEDLREQDEAVIWKKSDRSGRARL